jgi:hypothetical protein
VILVPEITKILLATDSITKKGYEIRIKDDLQILLPNGDIALTGQNHNGLYYINTPQQQLVNSTTSRYRGEAHRSINI